MTKITITLTSLFIAFMMMNALNAQDFNGKALYKSYQKIDIGLDTAAIPPEQQDALKAMLAKQLNKEYDLVFDQYQSSYKEVEELEEPAQANGMVFIAFSDDASLLYKNIKDKKYVSQRDVYGKGFLVKDALKTEKWKMTNESKQIGKYTCYKATTTRMKDGIVSINEKGERTEQAPEEVSVIAWYAPEIPVSNGPDLYWGLPGLIMEVNDGVRTTICTRIELNPSHKATISVPTNGKEITEEEFEEIMVAKMQEMEKIESGGRQKEEGHRIEIQIGG